MADIASTDVVVTLIKRNKGEDNRQLVIAKIEFGNDTLTYPAGGVPISIGAFGCRNNIDSMVIYDSGTTGYTFSYDNVNKKIVMRNAGAHTHNLFLKNGAVADGAGARVNAEANKLGANAGSDITVTGIATATGNGGIVGTATQPSAVAIAAQTLYVEVKGW